MSIANLMRISWAVHSDPGLYRSQNEDNYGARPDLGLFVVADGMGGHVGGEVASKLAVEAIQNAVDSIAMHDLDKTWPIPFDRSLGFDGNRLRAGFALANRSIAERSSSEEMLRGMATTAVAVLVTGASAALAHVGDSRAYLYRANQFTRLTRDHSWVEEQVQTGMLSEVEAREHPWRHIVTKALSGGVLDVEVTELQLKEKDRLLLCSDGLTVVMPDKEISNIVATMDDPKAACDALVHHANDCGGPDNVTTLIIDINVD